MKTLYISDLDGTLLRPNVELSKNTVTILNELVEKGVLFTVATARSIASVRHILKDVSISLPIILMNGVCIYDWSRKEYIRVEFFSREDTAVLMSFIRNNHLKGFVYTIKDGELSTYYEELSNQALKSFHDERVDRYKKNFTRVDSFSQLSGEPVIYFTLMDSHENLEEINRIVEKMDHLNCVFYKDNYTPDMWYLEIFSKNASKYHAVNFLRNYLKAETIVCFGDNRNDLSLFEASDEKYAVANAVEELKAKADAVIGSNTNDGVAVWLKLNSKTE